MFATNPGLAKTDLNYYAGDTVLYKPVNNIDQLHEVHKLCGSYLLVAEWNVDQVYVHISTNILISSINSIMLLFSVGMD